jgi:hypothetical protein
VAELARLVTGAKVVFSLSVTVLALPTLDALPFSRHDSNSILPGIMPRSCRASLVRY